MSSIHATTTLTHSLTRSLAHFGAHGKYVMLEDRLAPSAPPLSAVP